MSPDTPEVSADRADHIGRLLRITSQNLKHGGLQTPEGTADDRWSRLAAVITAEAPDILAVQEVHGWRTHNHQQVFRAEKDLGMRLAGWFPGARSISGTVMFYRHRPGALELTQWEDKDAAEVYHGKGVAVFDVAGVALTVAGVHFNPASAAIAEQEAARTVARVQRYGPHGVMIGDINHHPADDPAPDPYSVPALNRSGRWQDDTHTGALVADRSVARYLIRAGMTDAAAHIAESTGDTSLLRATGKGRIRVDQAWCTETVVPALTGYRHVPHEASDHALISIDLDTERLAAVEGWTPT